MDFPAMVDPMEELEYEDGDKMTVSSDLDDLRPQQQATSNDEKKVDWRGVKKGLLTYYLYIKASLIVLQCIYLFVSRFSML